ncbi:MAG: glycoside hydrolase family 75 protein [Deltaproteobacteria bacterium]|nr:glycoside hydrolase family 75 protein [Deltaproteobacteria bacterium]
MTRTTVAEVLVGLCAVVILAGCAEDPDFYETEGASDMNVDSISSSYPAGTLARTLGTANFRACGQIASRCAPYGQLSTGTRVTFVTGVPSNGFYEVTLDRSVGGQTRGFVHGNLLTIVSVPSAGMPPMAPADRSTAEAIVARTQSCTVVPGSPRYAKDSGGTRNIPICQSGETMWFRADLDIDCDGGSSSQCRSDPYYQRQTSGTTSTGQPLDASRLNFVVVPLDTEGFSFAGRNVRPGTVVAVVYGGRLAYGIVGDLGPRGAIGEASAYMAQQLGINASPTSGGVESGVTYVLFPGVRVTRNEDAEQARALASDAVHRWLGR